MLSEPRVPQLFFYQAESDLLKPMLGEHLQVARPQISATISLLDVHLPQDCNTSWVTVCVGLVPSRPVKVRNVSNSPNLAAGRLLLSGSSLPVQVCLGIHKHLGRFPSDSILPGPQRCS